jgi:hypothetical protein
MERVEPGDVEGIQDDMDLLLFIFLGLLYFLRDKKANSQ